MTILDDYQLCGACQIWGGTPRLNEKGVCDICDRSKQEILKEHGIFEITPAMIQELIDLNVAENHIFGMPIK